VALFLLIAVGTVSSVLANIPVVAASVLMVKGYFVVSHMMPEELWEQILAPWPLMTTAVFRAMMFWRHRWGGNATLIGASAKHFLVAAESARLT